MDHSALEYNCHCFGDITKLSCLISQTSYILYIRTHIYKNIRGLGNQTKIKDDVRLNFWKVDD